LVWVSPTQASSAITRSWHCSASEKPTPTARPLIAAISGFSRLTSLGWPPPPQWNSGLFGSSCGVRRPWSWYLARNFTSRPALNAAPVPVTMPQ
jgi:hypothetical protein